MILLWMLVSRTSASSRAQTKFYRCVYLWLSCLPGNADYAIIEAEADKVAKQAAEHLRRAKKRMRDYSSADNNDGPSPSRK